MNAKTLKRLAEASVIRFEHTVATTADGHEVDIFSNLRIIDTTKNILARSWHPVERKNVKEALFLFSDPQPIKDKEFFFIHLNTIVSPADARQMAKEVVRKEGYVMTEENGHRCYNSCGNFSYTQAVALFIQFQFEEEKVAEEETVETTQ